MRWAATIGNPRSRRLCFESLAKHIFPKKKQSDSVSFDFDAWSVGHPELAAELRLELIRKNNDKGGSDDE
ncbi:hypothetical protein BSZ32_01980 [Rubritalea profundi]|uniref:Uncharacterized protein n=1 Tax=Rubritalea profundi TaxID=1658618 RepID=A0A2S7TZ33_9BACT|nr:hypothetical protein BSZ32_01980 [Rubritalea profundi]